LHKAIHPELVTLTTQLTLVRLAYTRVLAV